jgi:hypothetical protein
MDHGKGGKSALANAAFIVAMKERDALVAQISELESFKSVLSKRLKTVENFIEIWREFTHASDIRDEHTGIFSGDLSNQTKRGHRNKYGNPDRKTVAAEVKRLILSQGKPVPRSQLSCHLREAGFGFKGPNPERALNAMLWHMRQEIVFLKGHGYWIANRAFPSADYEPRSSAQNIRDPLSIGIVG